jgi:hypothetical protein
VGLQKLLSTASQVEVMQRELKGLQPILARTSQETEDMMVVITNDKKEAGAWAFVGLGGSLLLCTAGRGDTWLKDTALRSWD